QLAEPTQAPSPRPAVAVRQRGREQEPDEIGAGRIAYGLDVGFVADVHAAADGDAAAAERGRPLVGADADEGLTVGAHAIAELLGQARQPALLLAAHEQG